MVENSPKRRFVRVPVRLLAVLDRKVPAVIRSLSLGGCLLDLRQSVCLTGPGTITFRIGSNKFELRGHPIEQPGQSNLALRFEFPSARAMMQLAKAIQELLGRPLKSRPLRLDVEHPASIDGTAAVLLNISQGGCFVRVATPHDPGEIIELRTRLDEEPIHLAAEVKWRDPNGIGLEFLLPDPSQVDAITQFIARRGQMFAAADSRDSP